MEDLKKTKMELIDELNQLRKSEEKYRSLIYNIPDVVWTSDSGYRIIFVGPNIEHLTGYTQEEEYRKGDWISWYDRVHPDDVDGAIASFKALIEGKKHYDIEYRFNKKDGQWIWIHDRSVGTYEKDGLLLADGLLSDITERKKVEKKLRMSQERLRSMASEMSLTEERERRRIATGLHDEVTQPLAAIEMKLDAIKKQKPSDNIPELDKIREYIDYIIKKTRSLTFDLSPPILYELGLVDALEWLAERFWEDYGIECEFKSEGGPVLLKEDMRGALFLAARELLVNIGKHARAEKAFMSIHQSKDKDEVYIEIRDNGIGFDSVEIEKSAKGYGLFSLRERLTYLGSRVEVESIPGKGTKVVLVAPKISNI